MYIRVEDGNLCKGQVVYDYHVPEQLGLVYVDYSLLSNSMECLNMYVVNSFISKKSCLMLPNYHTPGEV